MHLSGKQKITISVVLGYVTAWILDPLITIARLNVEKWAEENKYDKLYKTVSELPEWIVTVWEALTGNLALGLVLGAVIVAFWDPVVRYIKRRIRTNPTGESEQQSGVLSENRKTGETELEWGFERLSGYYFIGISAGDDQQLLVHKFQARGINNTSDPISEASGYFRSDRTGKKYPLFFNVRGTYVLPDEINPIPVGAIIDVGVPFSEGWEPISMRKFLEEFVPFTFFFDYDGKQYRRTFSLEEVEPLIRKYEQQVRESFVKPPQVTRKKKPKNRGKLSPNDDNAGGSQIEQHSVTSHGQSGGVTAHTVSKGDSDNESGRR